MAVQLEYYNNAKYSLEIKTGEVLKKEDGTAVNVSKAIHLMVDWDDINNRPDLTKCELVYFGKRPEFPSTGDSEKIYVAIDENRVYRFDDTVYRIIGSDWNEITLIDCGGA